MNGRVSRGIHTAQAGRILPIRRGERFCTARHDTDEIKAWEACPECRAVK